MASKGHKSRGKGQSPSATGHSKTDTSASSSPSPFTATKLSFLVLVASLVFFSLLYHDTLRPEEQRLLSRGKWYWDQVQQLHRPLWAKASALFGGTPIRADAVLGGLLRREKSGRTRSNASIAIGLGACTDMVVDSLAIFDKFAAPSRPQPHSQIETMQDLLELFAYYFSHGAASERYIKSKSVFEQLLSLIHKSPSSWRDNIGGNAPLMSERFSKEGIGNLLLGAQMSHQFASQLPANIAISGPVIEKDDYHILLEYKTAQRWGRYKSPRANRLIVHSDDNNAQLVSRAPFFAAAAEQRPDLLIISGLQMLDNSPSSIETRAQAIEELARDVQSLHRQSDSGQLKVHFELASYTENRLLGSIVDSIFPHVDSFGMNEQEVANLLSFLRYGNISFVSSPFPRIAHVLDEMRQLYQLLSVLGDGRLSRIHVHTLAYQVVAVRIDGHKADQRWPQSAAAMAKASLTAYRHTCGSEEVDLATARILLDESFTTSIASERYKQRIYFDPDDPTACWTEDLPSENPNSPVSRVQFCLAVGMVCTNVLQTGGAGDNVSAGGLVLQI